MYPFWSRDNLLRWRIRDVVSPTHVFFVRHATQLFMKYSIPLALLAAVRTFADGVNAAFTVIPRSSNCSHFVFSLAPASSAKTWPWLGGLLHALNGRSYLRDQLSASWIDDLSPKKFVGLLCTNGMLPSLVPRQSGRPLNIGFFNIEFSWGSTLPRMASH